jgi:acetylornithine/N-succinyldiaminopimelate aminotransferase
LSITYKEKYREGYEPFLPDVIFLTHNKEEELVKAVNENTAAVFLEFIQGEGGLSTVSENYVKTLSELKKKYNFLIVADCIQCGAGRTGKFLSIQHYDIEPDICVIAKGIGGGLPLGAIMIKESLKDLIKKGEHGTTFGGNPVSCAAGIAVMDELENGVMANADEMGKLLKSELEKLKNEFPEIIKDIRGIGLMLGVELENKFAETIMQKFMEKKIFVNVTNNNVLRLIPPLIISEENIKLFTKTFRSIIVKS